MSKIILITGANRGIGFETARQLGKSGHTIILTARDEGKGEEAASKLRANGIQVHYSLMDVSDESSIQRTYNVISTKFSQLDVIINNAAVLLKEDRNILSASAAIIHETINTNVIGAMQVVRIFAGMLKHGSRVINVSSGGGSMNDPIEGWNPVYCVSKAMLNMVTRQQSYFLQNRGVSVNAVCPGWVKTDMGGKSATRSPERGAETIVWLATEASPILTGKFFRDKKEIPW